jgi:hypothetical protein
MDLEQLMGRYFRLKQELAIAYRAQPWQTARLDRLAEDLAATEKEIVAARTEDEQCGETNFGFLLLSDFAM